MKIIIKFPSITSNKGVEADISFCEKSNVLMELIDVSNRSETSMICPPNRVSDEDLKLILMLSNSLPNDVVIDRKRLRSTELSEDIRKYLGTMNKNTLFRLCNITSAQELDFRDLHAVISKYIYSTISNKSLDKIRQLLNIEQDLKFSVESLPNNKSDVEKSVNNNNNEV